MLMKIVVLVVGCVFGSRILCSKEENLSLKNSAMTKIGTTLLISMLLSCFLSFKVAVTYLFIMIFPDFLRLIRQKTVSWFAKRSFEREFSIVLNEIIVRMSGGTSFRQAFSKSIDALNGDSQRFWRETFEVVTFSQQISHSHHSKFKDLILKEFREADQQPQSALRRLKNFRRRYKLVQSFRRRSGAMTQQTRWQSYILTAIYFFMLLMTLAHFDWRASKSFIGLSVLTFAIGAWWTLSMGRKVAWKL